MKKTIEAEKIKDKEVKLKWDMHNNKLFVEYESVMEIIKRHDLLVDELRGKSE